MSKGVLGYGNALAEAAGVLKDVIEKLASRRGILWFQALKEFLRSPLVLPMDTESQMERLRSLYRHTFGIDLGEVVIPERKPGFDRLIVVPKGLFMTWLIEGLRKEFDVSLYTEGLDVVTSHERYGETYAVWVRETVEADVDLANKSADDIKVEGLTTETLLERLLHEFVYYSEREEHLDVENSTLCAGSRQAQGYVPSVFWRSSVDNKLYVHWNDPDTADSGLRAREVVALPPQTS